MQNRFVASLARTVLVAFTFVFLEWLFLATKPSFLGTWPFAERVLALFTGAIPFVLAALAAAIVMLLPAWIALRTGHERLGRGLLRLVPSLVLAAIVLMLVDNFTYTMTGWGIVRTTTATAALYWVFLLVLVVVLLRRKPSTGKAQAWLAAVLLLACGLALAWSLHAGPGLVAANAGQAHPGGRLPNIILFASDGVNADQMSAYGYKRKTTPNLDRYLDRAMVADNAFTNSAWTTGSLTSMLTGKYPTTTKVLYPPYTLEGGDAYQSLPRMLRGLGYRNLQETVRYYGDGPDLNMEEAFDQANGRAVDATPPGRFALALQKASQFAGNTWHRLSERVLQLARVRQMEDPHAQVAEPTAPGKVHGTSDAQRMQRVAAFIQQGPQPFFIHIHLLGTHCCTYPLERRVFSKGEFPSKKARNKAELDDAILESDRLFGEMMDLLERRGLLENTIVVYTSDHNTNWEVRARTPLVFLFPGGAHKGHVGGNSQLLDVAPTLLDYLQLDVPGWMEGQSLLDGGFGSNRPVYSIYRLGRAHFRTGYNDRVGRVEDVGPPTYGLRSAGMVVCNRWYIMQLEDRDVISGKMDHYRGKCAARPPSRDQAAGMISQHLLDRGFEF
jgi:arylsulfatase A-like enzyme